MDAYAGFEWIFDCIEYMTTGDTVALSKLADRPFLNHNTDYALYLAKRLGQLCDTLPEPTMFVRMADLLEQSKAATAIVALYDRNIRDYKAAREIKEQTTSTNNRLLFWGGLMAKLEPIRFGTATCPAFHGVRHAWMIQALTNDPAHAKRQRFLLRHGFEQEELDAAEAGYWRQIKAWLPAHDVKFFNAVMDSSLVLEKLGMQSFTDFANRYSVNLQANTHEPAKCKRFIRLYTEGVLRGFLEPKPTTQNYTWFLASEQLLRHPSLVQAIEDSFRRLTAVEGAKLADTLDTLLHYTHFDKVLPEYEARPDFAAALGKLSRDQATKLIEKSVMRDRWLNCYPKLSEDVLIRELGL
ncbi:hypothetical protein DV532_28220 (plasmid) [Pseudomonas sp. Leaf58]|uniref:hypothetical protein n=1 Tax=Pseudomonas sp. Leaf58 TaxID=1736226 RepID=UPI000A73CC1C|nr:hypothetical protein [Pseudomonas sp. Leaf58]AYG48156.1 hypothetical protein DV532_28220 [Pseudomonas sp. Leaf58]